MEKASRENLYKNVTVEVSERINILKWIFIVMVVFIHSSALPRMSQEIMTPQYVEICKKIITEGICSMAVPGFFLIAGFFLFRKHIVWSHNIKKKLHTILIPYIIINTFWILLFALFSFIPSVAPFFEQYRLNSTEDIVGAYLNGIPYYYPFWFLRDLFVMNIIAGILQWLLERFPIVTVIGTVVIYFFINIPVLVENDSFLFFVIGACIARFSFNRKYIDKIPTYIIAIVYMCLIVDSIYGQFIFAAVRNLIGILLVYRITQYIYNSKTRKFFVWSSQFSFFIYAFHEYYEAIIKKILFLYLPQSGTVQLLEYFLLPICMVFVLMLVGNTMSKITPKLYKVVCGQR